MPGRKTFLTALSATFATLLYSAAQAREELSDLCLQAASNAAERTGVPYDVLRAISTVETGRKGLPWPWAVNFGGDGRWYDTAADAEVGVTEALGQGATNIDLGCFQLNYRWHSAGFASVADMLDPMQNATYAAEFLAEHFAQTGDWALAAAAYHSGTPEYAAAYQAKFEAVYARLTTGEPLPLQADPTLPERENRFPLLVAGGAGAHGSLVPANSGGIRLIGAP
jgi:hypothetical protein